jgi:hypothetical protein
MSAETFSGTPAQEAAWTAKAVAPRGKSLADLRPDIAASALRCVDRPSIHPSALGARSNLRVEWRCQCGATFVRTVSNASRYSYNVCRICSNRGKSRMEYEVAEVLQAYLGAGIQVRLHYACEGGVVDMFLPEINVAIDLDPFSTHRGCGRRDQEKSDRIISLGMRFIRVREGLLPRIQGCENIMVPEGRKATQWANEIASYLKGAKAASLSSAQEQQALEKANHAWASLLQSPPENPLSGVPALAKEFVANLSHPGRNARWIPLGCGDTCVWKCQRCGTTWEASVCHRSHPKVPTGCPDCSLASRVKKARTPPRGASLLDLFPTQASEFVSNLCDSTVGPQQVFPNSGDICLWRCSTCAHRWKASPNNRCSKGSGCPKCCKPKGQNHPHFRAGRRRLADILDALSTFAAREGNCFIPPGHTENGLKLDHWVKHVRKYRSNYTPAERSAFDALPHWYWSFIEEKWAIGFLHLAAYVNSSGHVSVTSRTMTADGYRIGNWVSRQRAMRDVLTDAQMSKLESLPGWSW